jgi:hypothetical protein
VARPRAASENAAVAKLPSKGFSELIVDDEASFSHVALYADLRRIVAESGHRFLVLHGNVRRATWDRALFLNLTFWHAAGSAEVLADEHIAADIVAHIAWHHLAARHLSDGSGRLSAEALLLSESIASAFDLYLVGRLLGVRPDAEFLQTQVPAMADSAASAGMNDDDFERMLETAAADPERAFEDLRALLYDSASALYGCSDVASAAFLLEEREDHRFAALLHHYELSNWVLYARAYGGEKVHDERARALDTALRNSPVALDWLEEHWVRPAARPLPGRDTPGASRRRAASR